MSGTTQALPAGPTQDGKDFNKDAFTRNDLYCDTTIGRYKPALRLAEPKAPPFGSQQLFTHLLYFPRLTRFHHLVKLVK
jgi:hypothetical protein